MIRKINQIPIKIEYRKVKNINLYIKPPDGHILVTAPRAISKRKIMEFIKSKETWIEKAREKVIKAQEKENQCYAGTITNEQLDLLKSNIQKYAQKWEPQMGVHASSWTLREMKTRWGSCTVNTGRIRINKKLALYPEICLEYIIVHELCHLLEPSHNKRFKDLMTQFLPDWKERRHQLGTG